MKTELDLEFYIETTFIAQKCNLLICQFHTRAQNSSIYPLPPRWMENASKVSQIGRSKPFL